MVAYVDLVFLSLVIGHRDVVFAENMTARFTLESVTPSIKEQEQSSGLLDSIPGHRNNRWWNSRIDINDSNKNPVDGGTSDRQE